MSRNPFQKPPSGNPWVTAATHQSRERSDEQTTKFFDSLVKQMRFEVVFFAESAQNILDKSADTFLSLKEQPSLTHGWMSCLADIQGALKLAQEMSGQLREFQTRSYGDAETAEIIRKHGQISGLAAQMKGTLERIYSTSTAIVQGSTPPVPPGLRQVVDEGLATSEQESGEWGENDESWDDTEGAWASEETDTYSAAAATDNVLRILSRDCKEALAMMNLFGVSADEQSTLSLYDLLAGCCFQRMQLAAENEPNGIPTSRLLSSPARPAAGAVCVSTTLLTELHDQLFELCARATAGQSAAGQGATISSERVLAMLKSAFDQEASDLDRTPQIAGLKAVASRCSRVQVRIEEEDRAVVSFTVPTDAAVFEEAIKSQLQEAVAPFQETLKDLGYETQTRVRARGPEHQEELEIGIVITIPVTEERREISPLTQDVVSYQAAVKEAKQNDLDMGFVFLKVSTAQSPAPVQLQIPKFLFNDEEIAPEELQYARSIALESLTAGFELAGGIRNLSSLILDRVVVQNQQDQGVTPVVHRLLVRTAEDARKRDTSLGLSEYIERYIESFLSEPRSAVVYNPTPPVGITMACPTIYMDGNALVMTLHEISKSVNIVDLDFDVVASLHAAPTKQHILRYLKQLQGLLSDYSERLAGHSTLNLRVVPTVYALGNERYLHFYLYDNDLGLCGLGTLSAFGDNDCLLVFTPQVAQKFAELITVIAEESQISMFTTLPWPIRVYNGLAQRSLELGMLDINALYRARLDSLVPLRAFQFATDLYSQIAVNPGGYAISYSPERFMVIQRVEKNDVPIFRTQKKSDPAS